MQKKTKHVSLEALREKKKNLIKNKRNKKEIINKTSLLS